MCRSFPLLILVRCYSDLGRSISKLAVIGGYLDLAKTKLFSVPAFTEDLRVAVVFYDGSLYLYRNSTENILRYDFRDLLLCAVPN